ncbi:MAG: hypothetical protein QM742_17860 [Aquabacterium sp.]
MTADGTLVPLNRTEHLFWACEGFMGSINQPYMMRFDGPVEEAAVRQALRELFSAYPRARGVIEACGWSYQLRILPDDHIIDELLKDCFRVNREVDPTSRDELMAAHNAMQNEAISMERGLPLRARFFPHPTSPALILSLHHIIGDGRSHLQMMSAVMGRLNGTAIQPVPLDSPSMVPAVVPQSLAGWPASIRGWWRNNKQDKARKAGMRLMTLCSRQSPRFTTAAIDYHLLQCSSKDVRALAKRMGTTVNNLLAAVIANQFLARAKNDPKAMAAIRISYDLRRLFPEGRQPQIGNFVSSFSVYARHQPTLSDQIRDMEAQVKEVLARYERREYAVPLLLYELLPIMGRRLYSMMVRKAKVGGKLQDVSCHFSNLGPADFLNPKDGTLRLKEVWLASLPVTPIVGLASMGDQQFLTVIYPQDEVDRADVAAFLAGLEQELLSLIQAGG